jgi:hypothetical protein
VKWEEILSELEYLKIPGVVIAVIAAIFIVFQIVLLILEVKGKIVLEGANIKRRMQNKNKQKQEQVDLLKEVKNLLNDVNTHYSTDNITQRNDWIQWVNNRAEVYDAALNELILLKDKLNENNEITLDLYINANRNRILDFSRIVADDKALVSTEEFNRIYKINKEYHAILTKYGKENGEVDTAMRIINEAYEYRLKNNCFIEDIRGYNK